jgi:transposase-like protein
MAEDGKAKIGLASQVGRLVSREELIAGYKEDGRTVYRREAKAKLIAAARQPGVSVARLAREHDLNANQLHAWIRQSLRYGTRIGKAAQVAVGMETAAIARTKLAQAMATQDAARTLAPTPTPTPFLTPTASPTSVKLLPVTLTTEPTLGSMPTPSATSTSPPHPARHATQAKLIVEIGETRIIIEGDVDPTALATVIACLRRDAAPRSATR